MRCGACVGSRQASTHWASAPSAGPSCWPSSALEMPSSSPSWPLCWATGRTSSSLMTTRQMEKVIHHPPGVGASSQPVARGLSLAWGWGHQDQSDTALIPEAKGQWGFTSQQVMREAVCDRRVSSCLPHTPTPIRVYKGENSDLAWDLGMASSRRWH